MDNNQTEDNNQETNTSDNKGDDAETKETINNDLLEDDFDLELDDEDFEEDTRDYSNEEVPPIVVEDINKLPELEYTPLRDKAENIEFPLSDEDKLDIARLVLRFDNEENLAGLSAIQLGIKKKAFIFACDKEDCPEQPYGKQIWINPTYRNAKGATLEEDYETCCSLVSSDDAVAGPIFRFDKITYRAHDAEGKIMEGEAQGFAARVIQHHIDHLDGKVFVDYVQPERLLTYPNYCERLENGTLDELQSGVVPEFV